MTESHRQRCKKEHRQSQLVFVQDLKILDIITFDDLVQLMILEQFKISVPDKIATQIIERKVNSPEEAAALSDD